MGWITACLCLLALSACERPFVEVDMPSTEIISPDLSTVLVNSRVDISVEANSFRPVEEVRLNRLPMTFDPDLDRWDITFELERGLNTLIVEAFDVEGVVGTDTAFALYLPFRFFLQAPRLPEARGGHTATLTPSGALLVAGGVERLNGAAHSDAFLLLPGGTAFEILGDTLNVARTGHSATRLPDGRILMLGGSRTDELAGISDLVETVELFDPATLAFETIPFEGQPIRRTLHTAILRNTQTGTFIDLYGGRGDIRYGDTPRLGTRRDLRTFELRNDTLFALNTLLQAPFLEAAISGHTQTQIQSSLYLVFGSFFDVEFMDEASFRIDYRTLPDLIITDTPPLLTPRTRHAAGTLGNGLVAFFGGRQAFPTDLLNQTEIYSEQAQRFFRVPNLQQSVKRFGHTATNLSAQRILLLGGFSTDGNSLSASEFFDVTVTD